MKVKIFSDGGARGNPGPAAAGVFLFDKDDKLLDFDGKYLGETTNNQAEYRAIILGLQLASRKGATEILYYVDSELAVKQLNGEYKVKNEEIRKVKEEVDKWVEKFDKVTFFHVEREKNKFADKLLNLITDAVVKNS